MSTIKVGIVGGTGYTGVELMRLLLAHPQVQICAVTSRADAGIAVSSVYPHLLGRLDIPFSEPTIEVLSQCDVVFFATPHAIAMQMACPLLDKGIKVIDLSPDFRLKNPQTWEQWYGQAHSSTDLLEQAVYGLPEMHREQIKTASLIACPGCYPTAVQLGFLPLLENQLIKTDNLIADVKSGVSGAGRKAAIASLASESAESVKAYSAAGHRHQPEIVQGLNALAGQAVALTFVPHLMPMIRGIHATLYATLTSQTDLQSLYEKRYANETFVSVLPAGSHPDTKHVRRSNHCQIAVHHIADSDVVVVLSVIDNLLKGASGQAVQCFNLMFGFAENTALNDIACYP